jgi:hypothetical protein
MKHLGIWKRGMFLVACLGMILPTPVLQAAVSNKAPQRPSPGRAPVAADVALRPSGVLVGQVVDVTGTPLPKKPVCLRYADREVAATKTDDSGYFAVGGLRGGMYEIAAAGEAPQLLRVWAPSTAPPSAQPGALVVVGGRRVRGQQGPIGYWLGNPWVVAGIVAAAISIPVAVHNHRIHRVSSP